MSKLVEHFVQSSAYFMIDDVTFARIADGIKFKKDEIVTKDYTIYISYNESATTPKNKEIIAKKFAEYVAGYSGIMVDFRELSTDDKGLLISEFVTAVKHKNIRGLFDFSHKKLSALEQFKHITCQTVSEIDSIVSAEIGSDFIIEGFEPILELESILE